MKAYIGGVLGMQRVVAEEFAETALKAMSTDKAHVADYAPLVEIADLTTDHDMPDQARAKLHKAIGMAIERATDGAEDADLAQAGGRKRGFQTALEAAARTIAPTISFYGRAPWSFDSSKDRRSPKFECIDARTAFALEEAYHTEGRDEVSLRLDTKGGKGRTYDFDLVNMTQCYRATAHDKFAYKPRAIKRYEFGTPEWSEYVRANHESSLRNISD